MERHLKHSLVGTSRIGTDKSHSNCAPLYSALDLLLAIQDGSVHGMSPLSGSDEGEMNAAMSVVHNAALKFTEPRGLLNRVRNARGYYPVVGLAVLLAIENSGKSMQKTGKSGNTGKKGKTPKGKLQYKGNTLLHV